MIALTSCKNEIESRKEQRQRHERSRALPGTQWFDIQDAQAHIILIKLQTHTDTTIDSLRDKQREKISVSTPRRKVREEVKQKQRLRSSRAGGWWW